mmetsp:Transcript_2203/g.7295  ORF Transcript_2203/g.7295 Transcript_2203/m.7295 type:complete len:301 (-) Transcript_2203:2653-3555(-)
MRSRGSSGSESSCVSDAICVGTSAPSASPTSSRSSSRGPKLRPESATRSPPAVLQHVVMGARSMMAGAAYDVVTSSSLRCPPTVTTQRYECPAPGTVVHVISAPGAVTAQSRAKYSVPAGPYVTLSRCASLARLAPASTTCWPPRGLRSALGVADTSDGGAYAAVGLVLRWPSMVTTNCRPTPAPGAVRHLSAWCAVAMKQPLATNSAPVAPYVTLSTLLASLPKLRPRMATSSRPCVSSAMAAVPGASAPSTAATTGTPYDVSASSMLLAWPATRSTHACPLPVPSAVRHDTCTSNAET